jgi:hypothetical protein
MDVPGAWQQVCCGEVQLQAGYIGQCSHVSIGPVGAWAYLQQFWRCHVLAAFLVGAPQLVVGKWCRLHVCHAPCCNEQLASL